MIQKLQIFSVKLRYTQSLSHLLTKVKEWKDLDLSVLWNAIDKTLPILIFHGENSDLLSTATIEQMKQGRESTTSVFQVKGVGHAPMLFTLPEVERIAEFLK